MTGVLILLPLLAGGAVLLLRERSPARGILAAVAVVHFALTCAAWHWRPVAAPGAWIALDEAGLLLLTVASALFLAAALTRSGAAAPSTPEAPAHLQAGCMLIFLSMMSLTAASRHLGILWVAVEATTLATAPLIYAPRTPRALEATWKYLLVCSVGIALALLGTYLLAAAAAGGVQPFTVDAMIHAGGALSGPWVKAAFVFLLVGYGTKMGLAPLHTWLPDAHSEAPSPVSALLSGSLLNCAFLAVLRSHQIAVAAGQGAFSGSLLAGFGVFSIAVAAVFLVRQTDYKRMLAYSSVEHMGLLAFGAGIGGAAAGGMWLHAANHSLTKAAMFLTAGGIAAAWGSKRVQDVRGILAARPALGALWIAGLFALAGAPPFGTFVSELAILRAAFVQGHPILAGTVVALLVVAFAGMARVMLDMAQGPAPQPGPPAGRGAGIRAWLPAAVLVLAVVALGLYVPAFLRTVLSGAAGLIGGTMP